MLDCSCAPNEGVGCPNGFDPVEASNGLGLAFDIGLPNEFVLLDPNPPLGFPPNGFGADPPNGVELGWFELVAGVVALKSNGAVAAALDGLKDEGKLPNGTAPLPVPGVLVVNAAKGFPDGLAEAPNAENAFPPLDCPNGVDDEPNPADVVPNVVEPAPKGVWDFSASDLDAPNGSDVEVPNGLDGAAAAKADDEAPNGVEFVANDGALKPNEGVDEAPNPPELAAAEEPPNSVEGAAAAAEDMPNDGAEVLEGASIGIPD